ncbi:hypothetical protein LTR85_012206 [Meristemomyces frigidus]|nr:hypothetical protein LTR85_012206 [Meristemomyces frigidus]
MSVIPQPLDDRAAVFHARTFASFSLRNNVYCVPVDEHEEQRQYQLNRIIRDVLDNEIVLAPNFPPPDIDEPQALDCGVGKGAWVEDLLDVGAYPDCEVTGVDIYFGQGDEEDEDDGEDSDDDGVQEFIKKRWNLNAPFRDDRSRSRIRAERFDLVNSRLLMDGINTNRWPAYVQDLYNVLKPGGWLQMVELELKFQSDNGRLRLDDEGALYSWHRWYYHTMVQDGRDPKIGERLGGLMRQYRFQNVSHRSHRLQIGRWNEGRSSGLPTEEDVPGY